MAMCARRIVLYLLVTASLIAFLPGTARSTETSKLSVTDLTKAAQVVILGRIVNLKTIVLNGEPWTIATFAVEQTLKGDAKGMIYFRIPGGMQQVNGRTLVTKVEGAPELSTMQRGVLFLSGRAPEYFTPVGLGQGYWRVEAENGRDVVRPSEYVPDSPAQPLVEFLREIERSKEKQR